MVYFVSICNMLTAIGILVVWIRESRSLPRKFVLQMSLRYVRFYLVYALMMNRFIRYSLWEVNVYGGAAVPYWPLTRVEVGMILVYLVLWVTNLIIYFVDKYRNGENNDEIIYTPLNLLNLFYPVMLPGLKLAKGENTVKFLSWLSGVIWMLGLIHILNTTVFALQNVK